MKIHMTVGIVAALLLAGCQIDGTARAGAQSIPAAAEPVPRRVLDLEAHGWGIPNDITSDQRFAVIALDDNIALGEIETGRLQMLTTGSWPASYYASPNFSPDGRRITYAYSRDDAPSCIGIMERDGSGARCIYEPPEGVQWAWPYGFTPDGTGILAVVRHANDIDAVVVIAVESGAVRHIRTFDTLGPEAMRLSPDGRYIAYARREPVPGASRHLYLLDLSNGAETRITGHGTVRHFAGWDTPGEHLYYFTDIDGTPTLRRVRVSSGRAAGASENVVRDLWRAYPTRIAGEALYFSVSGLVYEIHQLSIDMQGRRILGGPSPLITASDAGLRGISWSPDGSRLAYRQGDDLMIRATATGEARSISLPPRSTSPRWEPNGGALRFRTTWGSQQQVWRADLESGRIDEVEPAAHAAPHTEAPVVAPDGSREYYGRQIGDTTEIVEHTRATGQHLTVGRCGRDCGMWALSPDARQLALRETRGPNTTVSVLDLASGRVRNLFSTSDPQDFVVGGYPLMWSPQGDAVLFSVRYNSQSSFVLYMVDMEGTATPLLTREMSAHAVGISVGIFGPVLHPDGRTLAFIGWRRTAPDELWALEPLPGSGAGAGQRD